MASDQELAAKAQCLADALQGRDCRLAAAESCTGGWIGKCLTDLAGCSAWFEGGVVCYSNAAKQALLGVSDDALAQYGAVSEAVAVELVRGAVGRFGADVGVAVTGIAGPSGGTAEKPVGLVWFGWYAPDGTVTTQRVVFEGDREAVRRGTVAAALDGLLESFQ
mgnify:CR=1 FL=1